VTLDIKFLLLHKTEGFKIKVILNALMKARCIKTGGMCRNKHPYSAPSLELNGWQLFVYHKASSFKQVATCRVQENNKMKQTAFLTCDLPFLNEWISFSDTFSLR